ncbi:ATP phosphoribosyltransferase regulatory subunit [Virgibacillus kekensis]|uniref:ATP phosphoribosyltransferase regulatory subunit n=1 Tax=Virgibacillus kekensis TaxID=202261 RepID=A0ABV9DNP7_9BACI
MQQYLLDSSKDTSVEDFQRRDEIISILKSRFSTYGYKQVRTTAFEYYDLYSTITGTINKDEMIKVVDSSGKVLVLRPDVTIPITRMVATGKRQVPDQSRLFYVQDVFRQTYEQIDRKETTQAGIECFGANTPETDAEILALAIHTLKDLGFDSFKLEVGHAGFFRELVNELNLSSGKTEQLQALIQSKNLAEMESLLAGLPVKKELADAVYEIPMLYGDPDNVLGKADNLAVNETMKQTLTNLREVYKVLEAYGVEDYVVFDLGLINNMNYYTGVIFQGFVASLGKPVLMGGRYDRLAEEFGASIPAIGFACEVDSLLQAITPQTEPETGTEIVIYYDNAKQKYALTAAGSLRTAGYPVITSSLENTEDCKAAFDYQVYFKDGKNLLVNGDTENEFTNEEELLSLIEEGMKNT